MEVQDLAVRAIGSVRGRLTWTCPLYATGYEVWRGTVDDFNLAAKVGDAGPDDVMFDDFGLSPATAYFWWIKTLPSTTVTGSVTATSGTVPAGGPVYSDLLKPLSDWAKGVTDLVVWWAHETGPKPEKPFVMLRLTGPLKVPGTDHYTEDYQLLSGMRRWMISVHCFTKPVGPDPNAGPEDLTKDCMEFAAELVASLDDPEVAEAFNAAQMGSADVMTQVMDVSTPLETGYERHAAFDFEINVPSNVKIADPGTIAKMDLTTAHN